MQCPNPECVVCHFGPSDGVHLFNSTMGLICGECRDREEEAISDMEEVYYNPIERYEDYDIDQFRMRIE